MGDTYDLDNAIECDNIEVIKYLYEIKGIKFTARSLNIAICHSNLDTFKYIYEITKTYYSITKIYNDITLIEIAIHLNRSEHAKYLHNIQYNENPMYMMKRVGYFNIVKYMHEQCDFIFTTDTLNLASQCGILKIVEYLYEIVNIKDIKVAIRLAATNDHFKVVKYLADKL